MLYPCDAAAGGRLLRCSRVGVHQSGPPLAVHTRHLCGLCTSNAPPASSPRPCAGRSCHLPVQPPSPSQDFRSVVRHRSVRLSRLAFALAFSPVFQPAGFLQTDRLFDSAARWASPSPRQPKSIRDEQTRPTRLAPPSELIDSPIAWCGVTSRRLPLPSSSPSSPTPSLSSRILQHSTERKPTKRNSCPFACRPPTGRPRRLASLVARNMDPKPLPPLR